MAYNFTTQGRKVDSCIQLFGPLNEKISKSNITRLFLCPPGSKTWIAEPNIPKFFLDHDESDGFYFRIPKEWKGGTGGFIKFYYKNEPASFTSQQIDSLFVMPNFINPSFIRVSPDTVRPAEITTLTDTQITVQLTSTGNPPDRVDTTKVYDVDTVQFFAVYENKTYTLRSWLHDENSWIWGYHHKSKHVVMVPENLYPGRTKFFVQVGNYSKCPMNVDDQRSPVFPPSYFNNKYKLNVGVFPETDARKSEVQFRFSGFEFDDITKNYKTTSLSSAYSWIALTSGFEQDPNEFGLKNPNNKAKYIFIYDNLSLKTQLEGRIYVEKLKELIAKNTSSSDGKDFVNNFKIAVGIDVNNGKNTYYVFSAVPSEVLNTITPGYYTPPAQQQPSPPQDDDPSSPGGGGGSEETVVDPLPEEMYPQDPQTPIGGEPPKPNNPTKPYVPPDITEIGVSIGGGSSSGQRAIRLTQKGSSKIIVDFINFTWDDIESI